MQARLPSRPLFLELHFYRQLEPNNDQAHRMQITFATHQLAFGIPLQRRISHHALPQTSTYVV